jgi:hypothetical protein
MKHGWYLLEWNEWVCNKSCMVAVSLHHQYNLHGQYFDLCRKPKGTSGMDKTGASTTTRTRPLLETEEM